MKYKKLDELSVDEIQVLRNIAEKNSLSLYDTHLQYVRWNRGDSIDKNIEQEFEQAFLGNESINKSNQELKMKYKKLHELSVDELQVLKNISIRTSYSVFEVQVAYAYWNLNVKVKKELEQEFEMVFLDGKSVINSGHVHRNDLSSVIQRTFKMINSDFPRIISKGTADNNKRLEATPKVLRKPKRDLVINNDDITNLRIELNRADISLEEFLERV